jgi:hypothetical protein
MVLQHDVFFKTEQGTPAANEKVYIVETFGNTQNITSVGATDIEGKVSLRGLYCAPLFVGVSGGIVVIKNPPESNYSVTISSDGTPTLERYFGYPNPALTPKAIAAARQRCF